MTAGSHLPHRAEFADGQDRRAFLDSHRALTVRVREFERLVDGILRAFPVARGTIVPDEDTPIIRRSPDRCVLQLGPVALTVAWLRSTLDSVADGQLLAIVWRGIVAGNGPYAPDRTTAAPTPVRSATVIWEEVLSAAGGDEASWHWRPAGADIGGHSSEALAERYVERLRDARLATGGAR